MSDNQVASSNGLQVVWTPSKKALATANFPDGVDPHTAYNLKWNDIPDDSKFKGFRRTWLHKLNNEAVSAMLAAEAAAEKKSEAFDPVAFLHQYRLDAMQEVLEGRMGMRQPSTAEPALSELDREIQDRAFETVRDYINRKGGSCNYQRRDARSLAWKDADGTTMQQLIDTLLTRKKGQQIIAKAQQVVAEREAERNAMAAQDEDIFDDAAE